MSDLPNWHHHKLKYCQRLSQLLLLHQLGHPDLSSQLHFLDYQNSRQVRRMLKVYLVRILNIL